MASTVKIALMSLVAFSAASVAADLSQVLPTVLGNHSAKYNETEGDFLYRRTTENNEDLTDVSPSTGPSTNVSSEVECPPLKVLDFLHFNPQNSVETQQLEREWPCEVRFYWLNIHGFVSVVRFVFTYITCVVVVFGLVVNSLSLCVLSSPPMSSSNISVYLRALAMSDIGALLFNVTIGWLRGHVDEVNNIYLTSSVMCFLQRALSVTFFYYSTWLVVALTYERLIMIRFPFKGHQLFNIRPSTCIVILLGFVCLVIGLVRTQLTGFEQDNMFGYSPCGSPSKHKWNYYILPFMAMTTFVPTTFILIGNICLLVHIRRSAEDHSNLKASKVEDEVNTFRITRLLLVISLTYLILLLPVGITGSIEVYWRSSQHKHLYDSRDTYIKWQKQMLLIKWIRGFFFFLFLLNYSINFFLYCISGNKFRETVKICLKRWLPSSCQCVCLTERKKSRTPTRRTLVISLSNLTLRQSDSQVGRRTSDSSDRGVDNVAFDDTETNHKQC